MAKCIRCGKSLLFGRIKMRDADICKNCIDDLGFSGKIDNYTASCYKWDDVKNGIQAYWDRQNAKSAAKYVFNVHWDDDRTDDILERYQKNWIAREDQYDGMSKKEIKESCVPGEKIFKYPPLDVDVELKEGEIDGNQAVLVYLLDGEKDPLIGYAPKTKAKKILQLLSEHNPNVSAELSGGDYRELVVFSDGEAVCNSNIPKPLKVQVCLDWSSDIE